MPIKKLRGFLLLVLILSVPLWVAAEFLDATKIIPIKFPLSALQFLSVFVAAILVTRLDGGSVRKLLARGIDLAKVTSRLWRVGIFILMPVVVVIAYLLTLALGGGTSAKLMPLVTLPLFVVIYAVSGYCEQLGWTAIMTDSLLARMPLVAAGAITGVTWAAWHIIPFIQTHNGAAWIFWQCSFSVIFRVLMTKIYVLNNLSVFATIALHATYNTAFSLLPFYGSSYDPMYMALATLVVTMALFARHRLSGSGDAHVVPLQPAAR